MRINFDLDRMILFVIITLLTACKKNDQKKMEPQTKIEVVESNLNLNDSISHFLEKDEKDFIELKIFPKDTIINNWKLSFNQLNSSGYENLSKEVIKTEFQKDDPMEFLTLKDSCYYLTLKTKEKDTFCDFNDGEYYEEYRLRGYSDKLNSLIFNWNNWEEAHPILINLNQNKLWILNPGLEVSPDINKLMTFSNIVQNPIYEKNELLIYELTENTVKPLFHFLYQDLGVFESSWIDASSIIMELKKIDLNNFIAKESFYFKVDLFQL